MTGCVFCKIIEGQIPGTIVYEDETALVLLDINQAARGHLLVVPREHVGEFHELESGVASHLMTLAARWAPPAVEAVAADGYNLLLNNGSSAGQEVMHVHLHLIPRRQGDRVLRMGVPARIAEPGELQETAGRIKAQREQ
jgi:histidine triad (HIT) family protein